MITAMQIGMEQATDEELLKEAKDMGRLLVTRDKDFGALTFVKRRITKSNPFGGSPAVLEEFHHELSVF